MIEVIVDETVVPFPTGAPLPSLRTYLRLRRPPPVVASPPSRPPRATRPSPPRRAPDDARG